MERLARVDVVLNESAWNYTFTLVDTHPSVRVVKGHLRSPGERADLMTLPMLLYGLYVAAEAHGITWPAALITSDSWHVYRESPTLRRWTQATWVAPALVTSFTIDEDMLCEVFLSAGEAPEMIYSATRSGRTFTSKFALTEGSHDFHIEWIRSWLHDTMRSIYNEGLADEVRSALHVAAIFQIDTLE